MAQNRICSLLGIRCQAQHLGDAENAEIHCGQAAGLIHDIPPAAKLIDSIIADLKKRFAALEEQVGVFG
jgi:NAD(P)H-dependent flavin oxidoreductase YrpB (nitropropane dioxygenase family)